MEWHRRLQENALISWQKTCLTKKQGGLGIKDFEAWKKALIAKLVWAIAKKKYLLLLKWIHEKYLKNGG